MENANKISVSEDEDEDLETLRLAALKSIKKKSESNDASQNSNLLQHSEYRENLRYNKYITGRLNKRGRFFNHRGGKNGQFNNQLFHGRARNSNLIAITPIVNESNEKTEQKESPKSPKLTLPQDRYCGRIKEEEKPAETDKFNRYNNSDASDEDSEEEDALLESEEEKEGELKRSDSLEALMQELDDEIQGKSKAKEEKPAKVIKTKKKLKKVSTSESAAENSDSTVETSVKTEEIEPSQPVTSPAIEESPKKLDKKPPKIEPEHVPPPPKKFRRSPPPRRSFPNKRKPWGFPAPTFIPNQPFLQPIYPQPPPIVPIQPMNIPMFPPNVPPPQPPPFFERPLSPLAINADTLTTQTLAPLSPRSAAFVLENRAIVEKRKRSPRRSYSRSPSPRLRRSTSPRPPRSPRRSLSPRRKSRSPKRRSLSPRRRSNSPKRTRKVNAASPKVKPSVRDRLGVKGNAKVEEEKKEVKVEVKKEEKPLDPVLEARRRKFESKEIKVTEGVIRLKPKEEKQEKNEETSAETAENKEEDSLDEDKLLEDDDLELEAKETELYSDEESGSENEGRFKTKQQTTVKPPVLSFSKLVNGIKQEIKDKPLPDKARPKSSGRNRSSRRKRSPAVPKQTVSNKSLSRPAEKKKEESRARTRIVVKSERHPTAIEKRFERKIEIKIKNPSKYEKGEKKKEAGDEGGSVERKVEVEAASEDDDTDIVVENDSGEDVGQNEGDLRAQLSKKRAEKLQKILPTDDIPSRLLQNALQGAIFKKPKKSKKKELTNSEGKLPIHMRLGIAGNVDVFAEPKPKRKSRKRKNKSIEEQV